MSAEQEHIAMALSEAVKRGLPRSVSLFRAYDVERFYEICDEAIALQYGNDCIRIESVGLDVGRNGEALVRITAALASSTNILTGEVTYEWPDEPNDY